MVLMNKRFALSRIFASVFVFILSWTRCEIAFRTGQYGVTQEMGFMQARKVLGGLDAGSYMQGGLSLAEGTFRDPSNNFIWELWPPGMSLMNFLFIKVLGIGSSPLLIWSFFSSLVTALLTYLLFGFLKNQKKSFQIFGIVLIAIFLISSATQGWLLDQGIMYAEGLTVLGLFLTLYFMGEFIQGHKLQNLVLSGLGLALAVFMRSVNLAIVYLLIACILTLLLLKLAQIFLKTRGKVITMVKVGALTTITAVPITLMAIWMSFRATWIPNNQYQWVTSAANSWKWYWMRDSDFKETGWGIVAGIDNWACQIDKIVCAKIYAAPDTNWDYQGLSIQAILQNPISFIVERIPHFWDYWVLNGRWLYPPQSRIPASVSLVEGLLFLCIFLFALFLIAKIWNKCYELALLQIAILFGNLLPLLIYHLEGRYFLPIKLVAVFIILQNLHICQRLQIRVFTKLRIIRFGKNYNNEVNV